MHCRFKTLTFSIKLLFLLTFSSIGYALDFGSGANGVITDVAIQDDGKILLVGDFTEFNGVARNRVVRLNIDGSVDTAFDPNVNALFQDLYLARIV